jgi:CRISPR-associated protein Cas5d
MTGYLACFTRPEFKVDRVSYEVITPTAASGILGAVLWHPGMDWVVTRIHVLNPIKFINLTRNEVKLKAPYKDALFDLTHPTAHKLRPQVAEDMRTQRRSMLLKDVDYVVEAKIRLNENHHGGDSVSKFQEMFERRMSLGQFYKSPYLGCREFTMTVGMQSGPFTTIQQTLDIGIMPREILKLEDGRMLATRFRAVMKDGVVDVPEVQASLLVGGII